MTNAEAKAKYRLENLEKVRGQEREAARRNRLKKQAYYARWKAKNQVKYKAYQRAYHAEIALKPSEKRRHQLKSAIRNVLVSNKSSTARNERLFGCTQDFLKAHIEAQFTEGMTWELYASGAIHIDHIIPYAAFDLNEEQSRLQCCHYSNLQPLWAKDNISKGDQLSGRYDRARHLGHSK